MKHHFVLVLFLLTTLNLAYSQSPYKVTWKKELPYMGIGLATLGTGAYLSSRQPVFTTNDLMTLDATNINNLHRFATSNFSGSSDQLSDVFLIGSHLTPFLLLAGKESRSNFDQCMTMYGEAAAINLGLTIMAKSIFPRPRPFVFNTSVATDLKVTRNAKASFFSGHTSLTAVNTFFVAKVYSDFYPDSKWKPIIWGTAAAIPAVTGYLRVAAGKHYPTDVIAGYAVGAAVGVLVPHLHRNKKLEESGLRFDVGYNSAQMTWNFSRTSKN